MGKSIHPSNPTDVIRQHTQRFKSLKKKKGASSGVTASNPHFVSRNVRLSKACPPLPSASLFSFLQKYLDFRFILLMCVSLWVRICVKISHVISCFSVVKKIAVAVFIFLDNDLIVVELLYKIPSNHWVIYGHLFLTHNHFESVVICLDFIHWRLLSILCISMHG